MEDYASRDSIALLCCDCGFSPNRSPSVVSPRDGSPRCARMAAGRGGGTLRRLRMTRLASFSRSRLLVCVVAVLAAVHGGCGKSAGGIGLPLKQVEDLRLPDATSRFDYASVDPARHRLFFADLGDGRLTIVDTLRTRVVRRVPGIPGAHGALVVPELRRVYVTATDSRELVTVDELTYRVLARTATGDFPDGIAYDPGTGSLWVSNKVGGSETVVDAASGRLVATVPLGGAAGNVQYDPVDRRMLVNVESRGEVAVIDPATRSIERRIPVGADCAGNHGLLIDPPARLARRGNAPLGLRDRPRGRCSCGAASAALAVFGSSRPGRPRSRACWTHPSWRARWWPARLMTSRGLSVQDNQSLPFCSAGGHDPQDRDAVDVGEREEHLMRPGIDGHGVGTVGQERPPERIQRAAPPAEDGNGAALGRYVEPAKTGIEREHVRLVAHREVRRDPPRS